MNEPIPASDLERRAAIAIRQIPVDSIHFFCASCAERFIEGYGVWLAKEILVFEPARELPSAEFLRRALDVCWDGNATRSVGEVLSELIRSMPGENEQPIFKTPLNEYFDEAPWLIRLGLTSILDPKLKFGLIASAAAIDFHFQLLERRLEAAGTPIAFDDLEFVHAFERDPGALAESAIQLEDARELSCDQPDLRAMRDRSVDHGRRVLGDVRQLLEQ